MESFKYISLPHGLPIRDRSILWASMIQKGVVISARSLLKAKERVMPALRVKRKMSSALLLKIESDVQSSHANENQDVCSAFVMLLCLVSGLSTRN